MRAVLRPIAVTLEMIKFQHTVFALPFAFLAAFVAARGVPTADVVLWVTVAMVGARSAAMAFNRLVDSEIDAANPRTAKRALPAGLVSRSFVVAFVIVSVVLFEIAAWQLNRLAFLLSPVALAVILGYSFTKRFTSLSHVVLGLALSIAPAGAWIAVTGRLDREVLPLVAAVLVWTAGFDILYALQDVEFDRSRGLFSIPSRLGPAGALAVARALHVATVVALVGFGLANDLGLAWYLGVAAGVALLLWQHSIVSATDLSRINAAFFTANGILSVILFLFGAWDVVIR